MRLQNILPRVRPQQNLQDATLREFTGGWNVLDDDMNLSHRFAIKSKNIYSDNNGNMTVRYGYRLFANCAPYLSSSAYAVEGYYFNNALIVAFSNGEIAKILGDGSVSIIWNATIAATLPGAPSGWSAVDFVSFAEFNGHLIAANGIDKPIDIDQNFAVEYLQDAATSTNINVPICKYVVACGRYLLMAGDPLEPDRIHISAKDAAGTWFGDPPPNDATRIDIGSVLSGATTIRGILNLRGRPIVMFAEGLIFGELGNYNAAGTAHEPKFEDGVSGFGSISHRSGVAYGDDGLFMDLEGVPSIRRTALSTSFKPERVSDLIDKEIKAKLLELSFETMENRVFSVYNRSQGQFMLFVPNAETLDDTTETVGFVYNYRPSLRQDAWCEFRGWNFTCAMRSLQGRIFFGDKDAQIWLMGADEDPIYTDNDEPIEFDWELPWLDFGRRARTKKSKYISFDTRGASEFTCRMYVDNFYESNGSDVPALTTEFSGGEQGLFGAGPQPYGGGRNTAIKHTYEWPAKFQIAKLRFSGQSDAGLGFVSITLHYLTGSITR